MQPASFLTSSCKYESGSVSIVLLQYGVCDVKFSYHGVFLWWFVGFYCIGNIILVSVRVPGNLELIVWL